VPPGYLVGYVAVAVFTADNIKPDPPDQVDAGSIPAASIACRFGGTLAANAIYG